ncbi:methyltransferase domain-containing protein [Desulfosporosinus sp. PR]|uniref:putative RNA methyltransferase n=1 Tax=Candidatus Desulfosporosinus nitrosoreducens TaxID=3401928 RepID=UPI0027EDC938|nr:methyltransferase domain-containing protein [Desulfosporosinus sp. PR]MDQ7092071.1 methyltransferase domain-containing protein [Desulfosporosinus sp. PR]
MSKNKLSQTCKMFDNSRDIEYETIFQCPLCSSPMKIVDCKSLICARNHCFDIAKQGYVNLLSHSVKTKYTNPMFKARKTLCRSGFFEPLQEKISQLILAELTGKSEAIKVVDAGCGEGSHLSSIHQKIGKKTHGFLGVGIDITKEGIQLAAKDYPHNIWCVADLAKSPFAGKQFDILLNILSPSNYLEFQRILADDGKIIKVIPDSGYLKELREIFQLNTTKPAYTNDNTVELFRRSVNLLDIQSVRYTLALDSTLMEHLVTMTPLSWYATETSLQRTREINALHVTIDLTILIGGKKHCLS